MAKTFKTPFANGGNKTTIPAATQASGGVSLTEGWSFDYERNPVTDEQAKRLNRGEMNYLFYIITEAIGELQRQGSSTWDEDNIPYDKGVLVFHNSITWRSAIPDNKTKPGLTDDWIDLGTRGEGSPFDPNKYYNKDNIDSKFSNVNGVIAAITPHVNGDIYPISRTTLQTNEYVCNGDHLPVLSNAGIILNAMPVDFKTAWGVKKVGTQLIKLPMLITKEDVIDVFSTLLFSPSVGINRAVPQWYASDNKKVVVTGATASQNNGTVDIHNVQHLLAKFTPVMWLSSAESLNPVEMAVYFEGTDNLGSDTDGELRIRQIVFGLYSVGDRYVNTAQAITGGMSQLLFYDKSGNQVFSSISGTAISNTAMGVRLIVTLTSAINVKTMTAAGNITLPTGSGNTAVTFSLTKEAII